MVILKSRSAKEGQRFCIERKILDLSFAKFPCTAVSLYFCRLKHVLLTISPLFYRSRCDFDKKTNMGNNSSYV